MERTQELRLSLGGHSFSQHLGNDPMPDAGTAREIVAACFDEGIRWFDTTWAPERIALGAALASLGRREDATILCWSHFGLCCPDQVPGAPVPFESHHLEIMQEELQTDYIDAVVVHPAATRDCPEREPEQLATVTRWKEQGRIGLLGMHLPGSEADKTFAHDSPYDFAVQPHSVADDCTDVFAACRKLGWQNLACTPFGRGWILDRIVDAEGRAGDAGFRAHVADLMLRYALFSPHVDRLIVAMRKPEWVGSNAESARRGPLSDKERTWLLSRAAKA